MEPLTPLADSKLDLRICSHCSVRYIPVEYMIYSELIATS